MRNIEIEHDGTCPTCKAGMYIENDTMRCVFCDLVEAGEKLAEAEERIAKVEAENQRLRDMAPILGGLWM